MLKRMTLQERFIGFLDTKDPNEHYPWADRCNCACGQFLAYSGIKDNTPEAHEVWTAFNQLAAGRPMWDESGLSPSDWTFGKLRDRVLASAG